MLTTFRITFTASCSWERCFFQGLCFLHQLVGEILLPDVLSLRGGVSRHYKAAGIEFIPGIFHDHVGFAGEKRLVYLQRPFPDHGIGADLVPCR